MSSEIVGHQRQLQELQADIDAENVSHAYLFAGPGQLGKMTAALWFAEKLLPFGLSEDRMEVTLRQIRQRTHPDLLVLDQLWIEGICEDWQVIARSSNISQDHRSKKSAPAKTDVISIDDIRSLQERLYEKSLSAYRCCIISSIERMHDEAANALLKILEEPPERLVFLLTTQALSSILPTITSRTRLLRFHPVAQRELQPLLTGLKEDDMQFVLQLAQGAPGIAKRLSSDPDMLRLERQIHGQAHLFWQSTDLRSRLHILTPLHKRGEDADRLLLHLGLTLREHAEERHERSQNAYIDLLRDLQTNAYRPLAVQRFALATRTARSMQKVQ